MLERIAEGRTDLVFDYVKKGYPPSSKTSEGGSLKFYRDQVQYTPLAGA
jgi:hypothetical protein